MAAITVGHTAEQYVAIGTPGKDSYRRHCCDGRKASYRPDVLPSPIGYDQAALRTAATGEAQMSDVRLAYRRQWHDYYSEKRIIHQWMQVHLLGALPVERVLEIGPYLGLVTAMLENAGYRTTTLDLEETPRAGLPSPASKTLLGDIRRLDRNMVSGAEFDAILCCETLEHIPYGQVGGVLERMASTGIRYLVLSVPYMGSQLTFEIYLNRYLVRKYTSLKKFMGLKRFAVPGDDVPWEPHKWEIGYRNFSLTGLRSLVEENYRVLRTDFTSGCRSVFFVCENRN